MSNKLITKRTSSKQILNNSIKELEKNRAYYNREIESIDLAIKSLKDSIITSEDFSTISLSKKLFSARKPRSDNKITLESVRDTVLLFKTVDFFTTKDICNALFVYYPSSKVLHLLNILEQKGTLESFPYKGGKKFKYVIPKLTNSEKIHPRATPVEEEAVQSLLPSKGTTVPGTGSNKVKSSNKDVNNLISLAESQGFRTEKLNGGHIRVYAKFSSVQNNVTVTISSTGVNGQSLKRVKSQLEDIGVKL